MNLDCPCVGLGFEVKFCALHRLAPEMADLLRLFAETPVERLTGRDWSRLYALVARIDGKDDRS